MGVCCAAHPKMGKLSEQVSRQSYNSRSKNLLLLHVLLLLPLLLLLVHLHIRLACR